MLDDEGSLKNTENPLVKSATCLLQQDINMKDFIGSLPQDLEVLVILYGGGSSNITSEYCDFLFQSGIELKYLFFLNSSYE